MGCTCRPGLSRVKLLAELQETLAFLALQFPTSDFRCQTNKATDAFCLAELSSDRLPPLAWASYSVHVRASWGGGGGWALHPSLGCVRIGHIDKTGPRLFPALRESRMGGAPLSTDLARQHPAGLPRDPRCLHGDHAHQATECRTQRHVPRDMFIDPQQRRREYTAGDGQSLQ